MSLSKNEAMLYGGLALGAVALLYVTGRFAVKTAAGIVSGDNALTRNATNAAGEPVSAYQGVPVLGTLGAGANYLSGGHLASFGESIGGWAFDTFGPRSDLSLAPSISYPTQGTFNYSDVVNISDEEIARLRPRGGA